MTTSQILPHYIPRKGDELFVRVLLERPGDGVRAGLISGPPGVGKTALARSLAEGLGWRLEYFLCHHWVAEEDLFVKLDPARVAALAGGIHGVELGDAYRPGVLLRAVLASREGGCLVLLDEWDKAPERVDALLLEFLQTGRVIGPFGEIWEGDHQRMLVIITDNGLRDISEPLLRRVYRYRMGFLPPHVEADLIRKCSGASVGVVRTIVNMMTVVRNEGQSSPSLQEGVRLAQSLGLAKNTDEVELLIRGFIIKADEDWEALVRRYNNPAAVLWGEYCRAKKEGVG